MSIADHFTESGKSSDEVVLNFGNGNKLFASENLLRYASPVFETMFEKKFEESKTREIEMNDKNYDDFLELLLCLHPGKQKPVDDQNVLRVVSLAHEYQMDLLLSHCKIKMFDVLRRLELQSDSGKTPDVDDCYKILIKANETKFEDLSTAAIKAIGNFGHRIIIGSPKVFGRVGFPLRSFSQEAKQTDTGATNGATSEVEDKPKGSIEKSGDPITECQNLFDSLPDELKIRVLLQRLAVCDKE